VLRRRTEKASEKRRNYPPGKEGREIWIVERLVASCGGNMSKAFRSVSSTDGFESGMSRTESVQR
jgi:hypothetical protein